MSKQTKTEREKSQKEEGINVQQTSQIFCCIQHILRRQDISYGSSQEGRATIAGNYFFSASASVHHIKACS